MEVSVKWIRPLTSTVKALSHQSNHHAMMSKRAIWSPLVVGLLLSLPPITIFADKWLRKMGDENFPIATRALFDSAVHIILGCLSWTAVTAHRGLNGKMRFELLLAAAFSAGVDIDHFIASGSLNLKNALHMASPPPFHDISLPFLFFFIAVAQYYGNWGRRWNLRYRILQLSTMMSVHLLRDAARRGLHVFYFATIPPGEPYGLFPFFLPFFPLISRCALALADLDAGSWGDQCYKDNDEADAGNGGRESPLSVLSGGSDDLEDKQGRAAMFY